METLYETLHDLLRQRSASRKVGMPCGEKAAKGVVRTIVPMHKSNYMMITDLDDLKGINNKGALIK